MIIIIIIKLQRCEFDREELYYPIAADPGQGSVLAESWVNARNKRANLRAHGYHEDDVEV